MASYPKTKETLGKTCSLIIKLQVRIRCQIQCAGFYVASGATACLWEFSTSVEAITSPGSYFTITPYEINAPGLDLRGALCEDQWFNTPRNRSTME
jgi:hypothetical protein